MKQETKQSTITNRLSQPAPVGPIPSDLRRFHKYNHYGVCIDVVDLEIVEYVLQSVPFFVVDKTPYVYRNGCYFEDANGISLKAYIQNLVYRDYARSPVIRRIYGLLIGQPQVQKQFADLNNQPAHWVNFLNGYFDVLEWRLIEHNPSYLTINQIPFSFNATESCFHDGENIKQFLNISIPDTTDQQTFWQYLGYCMTTDTRFQKFMLLKGCGGTGKSVAISLIQNIIGSKNYSSISLQDLNRRFYATGLFGKLLNACADIPSTSMSEVDVVKKAVGEDTLLYEKKGQDPAQFQSYAKLLFSANKVPTNTDDTTKCVHSQ